MNKYFILGSVTSGLLSASIHFQNLLGLIHHAPVPLKAPVTTDRFGCRLICRTPGGQKRHKKTDDSISVKTPARFNLLSIQSALSLSKPISLPKKRKSKYLLA